MASICRWEDTDMKNNDTGFYGDTTPIVMIKEGKLISMYRDTAFKIDGDEMRTERQMEINGRPYRITSVFPNAPKSTPTEKIIELMDLHIKNKVV